MPITRVLVDANVLYSKTLRDWLALIYLCQEGEIYNVYWTEDILAEVIYRLRRHNPQWDGKKIASIRKRIEGTFEGGRVEDFVIDDSFPGKDGNDAHVHAAALACDADILLTCDKGFKDTGIELDLLPYEVYEPDEFFILIDDSAPFHVQTATQQQTEYWGSREGRAPLAKYLAKAGCPRFAERVRLHQSQLSLPATTDPTAR